jgi:hypothetical protein
MNKKCYLTEVVLLTKSYNLQDFKDWLHWHLDIIGFDCCHIFDNESSVDIKSVCDSYGDKVTYELVKGWPNQYALYDRYINNESKAWWVLPIDDDEFLYVSDKYHNNVNEMLMTVSAQHKDWNKICVGWRNLFPKEYTEERINEHLILNATGWSDQASMVWQVGNRPVKTFVKTTQKYEYSDRIGHNTHDPLINGNNISGKTLYGIEVKNSWQVSPTPDNADIILYHYQFRCNKEWVYKCTKRISAGAKNFKKNFPELYRKLYGTYKINEDNRVVNLWNK